MKNYFRVFALGLILGIIVLLIVQHIMTIKNKSEDNLMLLSLQEDYIKEFKNYSLDYSQIINKYGLKDDYALFESIHNILKEIESVECEIFNNKKVTKSYFEDLINNIDNYCNLLGIPDKSQYYVKAILSLLNSKSSVIEKKNQLKSVEIMLIQEYMANIYKKSVILSGAELLSFPEKDTIKLGDKFMTNFIFSVYDITENKMFFELINDTSVRHLNLINSKFEETPSRKGHHHHEIMLMYTGFYRNNIWQTSVDYYVE